MNKVTDLKIQPVTEALWPQLEQLFGKSGACNGCWCMYWRIGAEYHKRDRLLNKEALHKIISSDCPSGLLAFVDNIPVGWCQLTPREDLQWLIKNAYGANNIKKNVWCISCFFIKPGFRNKGLTEELVKASIKYAKKSKAEILEAYPRDSQNSFTGYSSIFLKVGFKFVADGKFGRKIFSIKL